METQHRTPAGNRFLLRLVPWVLPVLVAGLSPGIVYGAGDYVGEETCTQCHEEQGQQYTNTAHGRAGVEGWDGAAACETCHGAGGAHVEADGDPEKIITAASEGAEEMCLSCHGGDTASHWQAGVHNDFDVTCLSCHKVHDPWSNEKALVNKNITENCLTCHNRLRKHLYQRSHHPVAEGLMSCVSCHDPHGTMAAADIAAITPNDKCYECHAEKRGPYLFEHQPVREDCMTCHNPHGSNQVALLSTSPPRLCQSCHLFGHHQTVPGEPTQVWNQNRSCINCHLRVHGSNHPSGVVFLR